MKGLKILIVENEPVTAEYIRQLLTGNDMEVVGIYHAVAPVIEDLPGLTVDLALVDIQLDGDLDGIHLASILREMKIPYIYLTSFADEATIARAKLTFPAGYLVKPFNERTLFSNIDIALYNHKIGKAASLRLLHEKPIPPLKWIFVKHKNRMVKVPHTDILWVKAADNYSEIVTGACSYLLCETLKELEKRLPETLFIRVHRSYLVNLHIIDAIEGTTIICKEKKLIPLGKSFRKKVMRRLKNL